MWYCLFVCLLADWVVGYVCVVIGIGSCEVVYSAWGLSSSARYVDFGFFGVRVDGCVVWLSGLERLGRDVNAEVAVLTCCMARFKPGDVFVAGGCLLGLFLGCSGFGGPMDCIGVMLIAEGVCVVEAWKLAIDCLPPWHFCMVDLVSGVGAKCIVYAWWGHRFVVDGGSHSWHVHPSTNMSCSIGVRSGRQ